MNLKIHRVIAALTAIAIICLFSGCSGNEEYTARGFAMDTTVSVTVYGQDISAELLRCISELESSISWSNSNSEVSQINKAAADKRVNAPYTAGILQKVLPVCQDTDFRMSAGVRPLTALWNITGEDPHPPSQSEIDALLPLCGDSVRVQDNDVYLIKDGAQIDLGAFGKGAACDQLLERLSSSNASGAVCSVGGSIALYGKRADGKKWSVSVAHPQNINDSIGVLSLDGGMCVSTSGSYQRYFESDGVIYHHILNACTGYPAQSGLVSVTVVCESGLMSDALSTACFIVGYEESLELLDKYSAGAVFVFDDGSVIATENIKQSFSERA